LKANVNTIIVNLVIICTKQVLGCVKIERFDFVNISVKNIPQDNGLNKLKFVD